MKLFHILDGSELAELKMEVATVEFQRMAGISIAIIFTSRLEGFIPCNIRN